MATEDPGSPAEMDEEAPEAFSMVWVKMEVDEEGTVEGLDNSDDEEVSQDQHDQDYVPERSGGSQAQGKRNRRKATTPKKRSPVDPEEKKFQCEFCDYRAMHKNALKYHTMKHTNEPPIACKFCNYTTKYPNSMKQHVLGQHTDKDDPVLLSLPLYKCSKCDYTTRFKWNLAVHQRKHAVEKQFQCDDCGFQSVHRYSFVKHIRRHAPKGDFMYQCDKCMFKTKYEGHISRHLAQIHKEISEKAAQCPHCEFSCRVKWRLTTHINRSRRDTPIRCECCNFSTIYMCQLKLHKRHHVFRSPLETDVNNTASELPRESESAIEASIKEPVKDKHAKQIPLDPSVVAPPSDSKHFILDLSPEEVDWRSIEVKEFVGEEKSFHCNECDYKSKYKASVQRHYQRLHTNKGLKPYKCIHCAFATKTQDQISLHIKRSRSHCQISCRSCDFTTFFKCEYGIHEKTHYPLKCKLCDFACKHNCHMQEHFSVVHLGNTLQCKYCDYQAPSKYKLVNHQVKHTSARQFTCNLCGYAAARQKLLLNHIRNIHSGAPIVPTIINDTKYETLKTINDKQNAANTLITNLNIAVKKHIEMFKQMQQDSNEEDSEKMADLFKKYMIQNETNNGQGDKNMEQHNVDQNQQNDGHPQQNDGHQQQNDGHPQQNDGQQQQNMFENEMINIESQLKNMDNSNEFPHDLNNAVNNNKQSIAEIYNIQIKCERDESDATENYENLEYSENANHQYENVYVDPSKMYENNTQNTQDNNLYQPSISNSYYAPI